MSATETIDTKDTADTDKAMVFYCDGSAMAKTGSIGMGFHGYLFSLAAPKKGSGNPTHYPTDYGYVEKTDITKKGKEVTPLMYFDGYGCTDIRASNNVAELLAAKHVIDIASDFPIKKLVLKTDSEYVRKGIQEWSPHWVRNRWIRRDGTPVPNQDHWKEVLGKIDLMTNKGVEFDIKWVKGHADILGNVKADKLATIGRVNSEIGHNKVEVIKNAPEGYWKTESNKSPLLNHTWLYFNTLKASHVPGEYFLGNEGEDSEFPGVASSNASYAVVQLKTPEPPIEMIRSDQSQLTGDYDSIVVVNLSNLYTRNRHQELETYGPAILVQPDLRKANLEFIDKTPISEEKKPQLLASRVIESISDLKAMLLNYRNNSLVDCIVTDVTEHFYTTVTKVSKKATTVERKLKDEFIVGYKCHKVEADTHHTKVAINLTLGIDIPERNALKRLEATNPVVKIIVWNESPTAIRYATVVHNADDYGIWVGRHSNLILVSGKKE